MAYENTMLVFFIASFVALFPMLDPFGNSGEYQAQRIVGQPRGQNGRYGDSPPQRARTRNHAHQACAGVHQPEQGGQPQGANVYRPKLQLRRKRRESGPRSPVLRPGSGRHFPQAWRRVGGLQWSGTTVGIPTVTVAEWK